MLAVKIVLGVAVLSAQFAFLLTSSPTGSTPLRRSAVYGLLGFLLPVVGVVIAGLSPVSVLRQRRQ